MYTLFIDTHDKNVLIIIYKDGKILVEKNIESTNKHSQITMPTIEEAFKDAKIDVKDLNNIIVVNGPGSFTGERIAVTIGKTMAYCLDIPIRVIDSLSIKAINIDSDDKYVALLDKNGAFLGRFDKSNKPMEDFKYLNKSSYLTFSKENKVYTDVDIDYVKVYDFVNKLEPVKAHAVKPLYVKGISALNDK